MSIGENIRKRRIELHLSQQELADSLGYKSRSSIAKIEKNSSALSHEKLVALANTLHTTVNYLLNGAVSESEVHRGTIISDFNIINSSEKHPDKKKQCAAVILAGGKNRVNKYNSYRSIHKFNIKCYFSTVFLALLIVLLLQCCIK